MVIELTADQRQALDANPGHPVDVVDPATNQRYVLLARAQYERLQALLDQPSLSTSAESHGRIGPMMLRSQKAFWRELAELLKLRSKKRQWVAYHGDDRLAFGATQAEVYQEGLRHGLERGDFYVGKIEEDETPPWGTLESDRSLYEYSESPDQQRSSSAL